MAEPKRRTRAQLIQAIRTIAEAESNPDKKTLLLAIATAASERQWRSGTAARGHYVIQPSSSGLIIMVNKPQLLAWIDELCRTAQINNFRPHARPTERELTFPYE